MNIYCKLFFADSVATAPGVEGGVLCATSVPRYLQPARCREEEGRDRLTTPRPALTVRLPPKPQFQFVQDNQVQPGVQEITVSSPVLAEFK